MINRRSLFGLLAVAPVAAVAPRFASGGYVRAPKIPMIFGTMGQVGEAGAEGIMPLVRKPVAMTVINNTSFDIDAMIERKVARTICRQPSA